MTVICKIINYLLSESNWLSPFLRLLRHISSNVIEGIHRYRISNTTHISYCLIILQLTFKIQLGGDYVIAIFCTNFFKYIFNFTTPWIAHNLLKYFMNSCPFVNTRNFPLILYRYLHTNISTYIIIAYVDCYWCEVLFTYYKAIKYVLVYLIELTYLCLELNVWSQV